MGDSFAPHCRRRGLGAVGHDAAMSIVPTHEQLQGFLERTVLLACRTRSAE